MRIALNATPLLSPLTGIGHYTHQLIIGLQDKPEISLDLFYATKWSTEVKNKPIPAINFIKSLIKRCIPRSHSTARYLQQYAFSHGPSLKQTNLYHEPNFLPFRYKGPTIITAHDLSWIRFPETHPIERVRAMNRFFEPGLNRSNLIITPSLFTKNELIDVFGIPKEKIRPIYLGVEPSFCPQTAQETEASLTKHNLVHGQYILSVGTLEPRKNLEKTLNAYMQLPQVMRKHYPLIIVGMKGWKTSPLEQKIEPLIRSGEIRLLGYLTREDLVSITAGALTLVYPSIYEGFGLPPLEAMSCGVPVISSNISSLPEVIGDGGILINPQDTDELKEAMETLISSPDIRTIYAKKALEKSQTFSWKRCVEETLSVYKEIA